ncbi:MAG: hypothetical protein D6736_01285 [Nitrospinota bacterium]|nr:MAG: hypothetical protein D6736_01285 [Nitrospinota bacterium]
MLTFRHRLIRNTLLVCSLLWIGTVSAVLATHEADHRFTIYGSVRDGSSFPGKPLAGREIEVRDGESGQLLQRGRTDQQGRYSLLLHVHNADLGRVVTVQTPGAQKRLELRFNPVDRTTERREQVDLVVFPR